MNASFRFSTVQKVSICLIAGPLALHCKPVDLTYVHTLLRAALCSCHSWSLDPVTWQTEVACGFPEEGGKDLTAHPKPGSRQRVAQTPYSNRKGNNQGGKGEAMCVLAMFGS